MTPEQKQHYNRLLESLSNQKYNEFYSFVRTTLTVTATVFGVFISFAKPELNNACEVALFKTAIVSLALCILAGVILLFASHFHISLQEKAVREAKQLCILEEELNVKNPWFFSTARLVFYLTFLSSFLSLSCFSLYTNLN